MIKFEVNDVKCARFGKIKKKVNEETWDSSNAPEFPKKIKKMGQKK